MFSIFLVILFCFLISIFANWYQAYSFVRMKRENNELKGQLHAAVNARSLVEKQVCTLEEEEDEDKGFSSI